jgi:prepilin-type N-terminal cleavage/methylation domain-containing protein
MRRQDGETESGFTLIELLIVIVVLGILAAIVVFSLSGVSGQSKAAACTSDGKSIEVAADAYQATTGNYPSASSQLVGSYLHAWPVSTNGYTFSLNTAASTVDVYTNGTTVGTAYDAGSASGGCGAL